jgi:hypothetical protein
MRAAVGPTDGAIKNKSAKIQIEDRRSRDVDAADPTPASWCPWGVPTGPIRRISSNCRVALSLD